MCQTTECPICGSKPENAEHVARNRSTWMICPNCGELTFSHTLAEQDAYVGVLGIPGSPRRTQLSEYLGNKGEPVALWTREDLEVLVNASLPGTQSNGPQIASVEQPFGCEPPTVYCPICGQAIIDPEGGGAKPCPHLAFIFVEDIGSFEYQSEDFQGRIEGVEMDDLGVDGLPGVLGEAGYGSSMLVLEITYGGMMCGPAWFTDAFGFDYQTLARSAKA